MSIFRKHHEPEHQVSEDAPAEYDVQADLALPHTGHEEEIDAGVGTLGGSLVEQHEHGAFDAQRDVGFEP